MTKNIEFIEVQSDLGAGTIGAALGASALQQLARSQQNHTITHIPRKIVQVPVNKGFSSKQARNIESIVKTCTNISDEVYRSILFGNNPVIISGDHSNAAGTIAGIKMAKPHAVLGVIWIDAHSDLHSPYTSPSGNMHGMPLAASICDDNRESSEVEIDAATHFYWEKYKNLGNISPKLQPENIIYVSLRDFEKEEAHLIAKHGITHFHTCSLLNFGAEHVVARIFEQLKNCTDIYISFDVDCLDASIAKGTGLPVNGGLMGWEAETLIRLLMIHPKVTAFEITELNPLFDHQNETTAIVLSILEIGIAAMQKQYLPDHQYSGNASFHFNNKLNHSEYATN